jgi:SAM-dependent methyltransferase
LPGNSWNHNIHYHGAILRALPSPCVRALDLGCGEGLLAGQLAELCQEVVAIDTDRPTLLRAASREARVVFVEGDVMTYDFGGESFDLITAVAALHHLPLRQALERLRRLLRPGGLLAAVGLYRPHTIADYAWAAAGVPASFVLRRFHHFAEVDAPLQEPVETLDQIRDACEELLPNAEVVRRLLFRYTLIWRKPAE